VTATSADETGLSGLNPLGPVMRLWAFRDLIGQMTRREVAMRYRGAFLGLIWSFVTPLLMLIIYTFVYSVIFKAKWSDESGQIENSKTYFALMLFAALIPYQVFAEVVQRSPTLILGVPNYVKKVVFPLEVLPVVAVFSAIVHSLFSICILVVGVAIFRQEVSRTLWMLPLAYLPLVLMMTGLAWFLSALGMYVRDVSQAVIPVVQIMMFLTPVFFPLGAVPAGMRWVYYANPLTTIVTGFRQTVIFGQPPSWVAWGICTAFAAIVAGFGYLWFEKTKRGFPDVL
jgi:lipopolysaccharide transport system permease protein